MTERNRDLLDQLQQGRDALRRFQQSLSRYAPTEQREALQGVVANMFSPADQLQSIVDLMDAFGPPLAQIESLRAELAEQREQVAAIDERLERMEAMTDRLALAAEQLATFSEPYVRVASFLTGTDLTPTAATPNPADGDLGPDSDDTDPEPDDDTDE